MKMLCIDGNSVLNRAFYAIKLLTTKDGRYTNAIYGFMNILLKLLEAYKPDAVAVAFDLPAPTFRHKTYDGYKATRKKMPDELAQQMAPLKEIIEALGIVNVAIEGYEADDILGALSRACREGGNECYIATGDRDSLQLVGDGVTVLLTTTQMGRGETSEVDEAAVKEKYGVTPRQLIDVKALMGDSSDNIPGVAGVGEKTALALIQKFGSLDGVYENINDEGIKTGVRQRLENDKEMAYLSRKLAEIDLAAPIDEDLSDYIRKPGDPERAAKLLGELEMHSLVKRLGIASAAHTSAPEKSAPAAASVELSELTDKEIASAEKIYIAPAASGAYAARGSSAYSVSAERLPALLKGDAEKYCRESKKLFRAALDAGVSAEGIAFDLSLAAYLLNPSSSDYGEEALGAEYGEKPLFSCEGAPSLGLLEPLCSKLALLLDERGMKKLHDEIELPLARVLAGMEKEGFLVDRDGIRDFGRELEGEIKAELAEVYRLAGREFNLNSPKQLGEVLFDEMRLPTGKKTKTGYSTNAEVLETLRDEHPIIGHILSYRTYAKLKSTYVDGLLAAADESGKIHTDFVQTETRTGRISSREPNLQNIPVRTELGGRLRKYFIARPGRVLLDADYSQIELRVLASMSGDERMIAAFTDGHDIHTETASEIFKVPRKMVTSELRRRAKAVNFGIVYGIGAFSLAKNVGTSVAEAREYIDGYLATYSGVAAFLARSVEQAQKDGYVTTMFGRRRMLPELASSNKQVASLGRRLAMNTPIQGTAADIIKIAMIRVSDRLAAEKLDAKLILQVHDELIVESSEKDAESAAAVLHEEMEGAVALKAPLVAEVGRGTTWYDAK